jgi:hypothetical protein
MNLRVQGLKKKTVKKMDVRIFLYVKTDRRLSPKRDEGQTESNPKPTDTDPILVSFWIVEL